MAKVVKDLLRGSSESTIENYKTKGFSHEGVTGSTPVDRLTENGSKGITPTVMQENNSAVNKIVKDGLAVKAAGPGVPADYGKVKNQKSTKSQSAGMIGANNANHS